MGRRMADAMRSLPWLRAEVWASERFCGGRVDPGVANPGAQPLETTDGRARVWFDGECRLPGRSARGTPDADAALTLVIGHPPAIVDADGVFNMAVLNDA